jgi:hypothetical protein
VTTVNSFTVAPMEGIGTSIRKVSIRKLIGSECGCRRGAVKECEADPAMLGRISVSCTKAAPPQRGGI